MTRGNSEEWATRKAQHIALSDAAAETYDSQYENANFATGTYMRYELEVIARASKMAPSDDIAYDLGCGTGRDSFELGKHFKQVYGFDFSPQMIRVADSHRIRHRMGNVSFELSDVEAGLPGQPDQSASLVNSAFGMGSFVEDIDELFQCVRRLLRPEGIGIFSFYNNEALVNQLPLEWTPALAARAVAGEDVLRVNFDGLEYEIPAKAYSTSFIADRLGRHFSDILELTTFPTLTALLPQGVLANERARQLCSDVDTYLSSSPSTYGPYIVAVVRSRRRTGSKKQTKPGGYARVLELLETHDVEFHRELHRPVRSMDDVHSVLPDVDRASMVKSVLVAHREESDEEMHIQRIPMWLFCIPSNRRLSMGAVAKLLGIRRKQLKLATADEVEVRTGFSVGSIPPFAMPDRIPVIVDESLQEFHDVWCGTGISTESMRIKFSDLRKLGNHSVAAISAEHRIQDE